MGAGNFSYKPIEKPKTQTKTTFLFQRWYATGFISERSLSRAERKLLEGLQLYMCRH